MNCSQVGGILVGSAFERLLVEYILSFSKLSGELEAEVTLCARANGQLKIYYFFP